MNKKTQLKAFTSTLSTVVVLAIAAGLTVTSAGAIADYRCHSDSYGNTVCRDNQGNTSRGYSDDYGNSTWRDNSGNTVRCYTDSYGNTTCTD